MRRSWLWFLLTVVGYVIGQLVGYLVSGVLGYDETNYLDITAGDRWILLLAVAPFMLVPPAMMFVTGRREASEGASSIPMIVGGIIFLFLAVVMLAGAFGVSA